MKYLLLILLALPTYGFAQYSDIDTRTGVDLGTVPGGVVAKRTKQAAIKNAGGKEMRGRMSIVGVTELRYHGLSAKGFPQFSLYEEDRPAEMLPARFQALPAPREATITKGPIFEHNPKDGDLEFDEYKIIIIKTTPSQLKYRIERTEEK